MNKKNYYLLLVTTFTLFFGIVFTETLLANPIEIQINTTSGSIKINNRFLVTYQVDSIEKVIGKPDRIEIHKFNSYIEEFPAKEGDSPYTYPITVTNHYYIYDQLGIMFYTQNSEYGTKEPVRCSIHFKNKRTFTNRDALPFEPKNTFSGILKINDVVVNTDKKMVPENVNYKTSEFELFKTSFAPTSIAMVIDGVYAYNSKPYLQFLLDNEKDQRASYLVIN